MQGILINNSWEISLLWTSGLSAIITFFSYAFLDGYFIICKINHLLTTWINAIPNPTKPQLQESLLTINHSLIFVGSKITTP